LSFSFDNKIYNNLLTAITKYEIIIPTDSRSITKEMKK
jgi:hypothetical protein